MALLLYWRLYSAAFIANLLFVSTGCMFAWPSSGLLKLYKYGITPDQGAWIASFMPLGAMTGSCTLYIITNFFGRKNSLILTCATYIVSWTILISSKIFAAACIGRFVGGYAVSLTFNVIPAYLAEISHDEVRQAVTSTLEIFIGTGFAIAYCGSYMSYTYNELIPMLVLVLNMVCLPFLPESPYYQVSQGKIDKASLSLSWLRHVKEEGVKEELNRIQETISAKATKVKAKKSDIITKRGYRKAFIITGVCLLLQQLSAINIVEGYIESILRTADVGESSSGAAIGFAMIFAVLGGIAPPMVRKWGSKIVLVLTMLGLALSLGTFSIYMYFKEIDNNQVEHIRFLPLVVFALYNAFFSIGVGPLPWSILAELSPPDLRSFIACVISTIYWFESFLLVSLFVPISEIFGEWPIFLFFSITLIIGVVFIQIFLPDTKAMSLYDIQRLLEDGSF